MGGGEITGGNWSAHCISTWQWITVCFIVCVRHFVHPSNRSVRSDHLDLSEFRKQWKKADGSETATRVRIARHTALPPQTQRRRLSYLQLHARPGVSFFPFFAMASLSPPPSSSLSVCLSVSLSPHTQPRPSLCNGMGRQKSSRTICFFLSRAQ